MRTLNCARDAPSTTTILKPEVRSRCMMRPVEPFWISLSMSRAVIMDSLWRSWRRLQQLGIDAVLVGGIGVSFDAAPWSPLQDARSVQGRERHALARVLGTKPARGGREHLRNDFAFGAASLGPLRLEFTPVRSGVLLPPVDARVTARAT